MALTYPLIQFGSVYATSDNTNTGTKYIAEIEGLDVLALTHTIQSIKAIDGTVYNQYQGVKDDLIVVRFSRMDFSKFDAIRDVINTAIAGATTYTLNITVNGESFTFTAKPAGITYKGAPLATTVEQVEFRQYVTD